MAIKNNLKKLNKIVGIEISENDIIVVEISFIKNNITITNGFRLHLPVFQDINKTTILLKQNLKTLNIKTKECVIGFSMQYFKLLPVPIPASIPKEEISSIIIQEGNIDPTKELFSWRVLNNTQRQDSDGIARYDVLGISIQKTQAEIAKIISRNCNLALISITPSFLGLGAFLNPAPSNKLTGTLWISEIRSEFIVWSGQEPIYEHLFLTHQLKDQVFESVNYIQTQIPGTEVSLILSCGTFAKEINLTQLPYNFQLFLLPNNIIDSSKVLQGQSMGEYATSLGIALASSNNFSYKVPNLLTSFEAGSTSKEIKDIFKGIKLPFISDKSLDPQTARLVLASALVILFSILSSLFIQNFLGPNIKANQTVFQNKLVITQTHLAKLLNIEKTNKILNLKVEYFSGLIDKRKPWSKILREIGDMTPKGLWIDRLEVNSNTINVFGRGITVDAVANFSINLNYTAKLVGDAQIIALRRFQEDGADIVEYQIAAQVKEQKELAFDKDRSTLQSNSKI